ncbi:MAG: hypothetical protein IJ449_13765 [Clostridia bacterium]|nr:hypothetical protein [Clostridia bacterium]
MKKLNDCLRGRGGNYILPFFWQHGEDDETLIREIDAIEQSGIKALCVESRTHEDFCGDGWWHTMDVILTECEARGMKVWILDDKHFPSGYANGIIKKKYPEEQMWGITERHMDVVGPQKNASVLYQWKTSAEDRLLGVVACRRVPGEETLTGEAVDLTDNLYDDMVYFDLPAGTWRIFYIFQTRSGLSDRMREYADKLTPIGGDAYLEAVYEPHFAHLEQHFGKTLAGFFSDEPCFGNNSRSGFRAEMGRKYSHFPYTEEVLVRLLERFGREAVTMLPALWYDSADTSMQKIRLAYMDIITRLYSENFTYKLGNWCREHGVEYIGHVIEDDDQHMMTQNSAGHYFRALDGQDMAGIDVVLCQIVPGFEDDIHTVPCSYDTCDPSFYNFVLPKLGSSHAHIQPEKKGRAMCEIYGAYGWAEGLKMMKWLTDLMLVRGINYYVPHAFTPKFPDFDCPPHFFAQGTNPQFARFRLLMDYMNRVCHLTNNAKHVPCAAVLYQAEAYWSGGEFMKNDVAARYLTEHQLDYDIVPCDRLYDAKVRGGKLCVGDAEYPCLVIPKAAYQPKALLDAAAAFAKAGLPVYFVSATPAEAETGRVPEISGSTVVSLDELNDTIRAAGAADITVVRGNSAVRGMRYYHCCDVENDTDYYLFTNEGIRETVTADLALSAMTGEDYVLYDAMENTAETVKTNPDGTLSLVLAPYSSVVIVPGRAPVAMNLPAKKREEIVSAYPLDTVWDVFTAAQEEYPIFTPYRSSTALFNLTGRDALPRFSGHMQYETSFTMDAPLDDMRIILDLGEVGESVTVLVNGIRVGEKIAPPYRFDITDAVNGGHNTLVAEVTNHYGYKMHDGFSKYLLFEPSGLLGPVGFEIRKVIS